MIRIIYALMTALLLIWLAAGCDDEPGSHVIHAEIQRMSVPDGLNIATNDTFTYRFLIASEEFAADSMVCFIQNPSGDEIPSFTLYDDGGQRFRGAPAYGSVFSGDASAGDHIFTRKISARSLADSIFGAYTFRFRTYGMGLVPGDVEIPDIVVTAYIGIPQGLSVSTNSPTNYFPACFPATTIEVHAVSAAWDPVEGVELDLIDNNWYQILQRCPCEQSSNSSIWRCVIDPTFFRLVLPNAEIRRYGLALSARTVLNAAQTQSYDIDSVGTDTPVLRSLVLPSTAHFPSSPDDTSQFVVTVELATCPPTEIPDFDSGQSNVGVRLSGWTDFYSFYFIDRMRDNGVDPDAVAGDNIYALCVWIPYIQTSAATICVISIAATEHDLTSNVLVDSLWIFP